MSDAIPASEIIAFSIKQAAAACGGVSRSKIYSLIARGKLTPFKIDGRTMIHRRDIEAYLNGLYEEACAAAGRQAAA